MANANTPRGFVPVADVHGNRWNGPGNRYWKGTTANTTLGIGDRVIRIASTDPNGYPEIQRATVGTNSITGIVVGIEVVTTNLDQQGYYTATQTGYLYVEDDPQIMYAVQEGGAGSALVVGNIGQYVNSLAGTTSTLTGVSADQIDNASISSSTGEWRIVGLLQKPDNALGTNAKWLVQRNLSTETGAGANSLTSN